MSYLSDARELLGREMPDERAPWPAPPVHDLEAGGATSHCLYCARTPVDRACPSCPRISVRIFRQWRDQPRLPHSRWERLKTVSEKRET